MLFIAADDSTQTAPSRPGITGALYAAGAVVLEGDAASVTERATAELCREYGFPPEERFKWSPGRELWMYDNLREEARQDFFFRVLELLRSNGCEALIVIVDASLPPVTSLTDIDRTLDSMRLLIGHVERWLDHRNRFGIMIMDQPGGGPPHQRSFLLSCAAHWSRISVNGGRIVVAPTASDGRLSRLLQAADLVTSCTLAFVSGEVLYSPPVFENILPLLAKCDGRIGGNGLLLVPSFKYANLYRFIAGDETYRRGHLIAPLPLRRRPYSTDPWIP